MRREMSRRFFLAPDLMIRNRSKRLWESRLLGRESQGAFIANLLNRWIARGDWSSYFCLITLKKNLIVRGLSNKERLCLLCYKKQITDQVLK